MGGTKRVGKTSPPNPSSPKKAKLPPPPTPQEPDDRFAGKPVPADESRERWPSRYGADSSVNKVLQAKSHYTQAVVDGCIFNLYDYVHVKVS
ncbi:DNA (cytosine-5)-methyltransferase CMT1-like [Rhododendron vialii]|uniref:DNA (cytosine-5)-methyltransferase CMT1-like n=1 Tax=Rhododendron vialii TaxID=182163 RepID=UPI00265EA29D|nr:DNA (cytosine-5)-methyltransferase CMT1-like [Rhododendron vialii]